MKIAIKGDRAYKTLFLEENDFESEEALYHITKQIRSLRFKEVIIPDKYYDTFKETRLYKEISYTFFIGEKEKNKIEIAKYIKY